MKEGLLWRVFNSRKEGFFTVLEDISIDYTIMIINDAATEFGITLQATFVHPAIVMTLVISKQFYLTNPSITLPL